MTSNFTPQKMFIDQFIEYPFSIGLKSPKERNLMTSFRECRGEFRDAVLKYSVLDGFGAKEDSRRVLSL
jgi:hypothetical protein